MNPAQVQAQQEQERRDFVVPQSVCKKNITTIRQSLVNNVFQANMHRCTYILLKMDAGEVLQDDLYEESNDGQALPDSVKESYRNSAWEAFARKKRTQNQLGSSVAISVARNATALAVNARTNGDPAKHCAFITWAKTKIAEESEGDPPAGSMPLQGSKGILSQSSNAVNSAVNAATKYNRLVVMFANEGKLFYPDTFDVIYPTLELQPRSDANVGSKASPHDKALKDYRKKKAQAYNRVHPNEGEQVSDTYPFQLKGKRPGEAGENDAGSTVGYPDWTHVTTKSIN